MRVAIIMVCICSIVIYSALAQGQDISTEIALKSALQSTQVNQGISMVITASLEKNNDVLNSREITRHLKMSAYVKQPDGSSFLKALFDNGLDGDILAGDGLYSCRFLLEQAGDYRIRVIAEGKGFQQTREHLFRASAEGLTAVVTAPDSQDHKDGTTPPGKVLTDSKTSTETGGQISQKFPWIVYSLINAVAAVFWIAGSVFLYLRMRRSGQPRLEQKVISFGAFIRAQAEDKMRQLAPDAKTDQKDAASVSQAIGDLHSARLLFLKGLIEEPRKTGEEMPALWGKIYTSFDKALNMALTPKKDALQEKSSDLLEKVEEIDGIDEQHKGLRQAHADAQLKKIASLKSLKDVIADSQQRFDAVIRKNRELEQKLLDAARKAGVEEAIKASLADVKENYRQFELCIATLEAENERLINKLGTWKKELDQIEVGPLAASEIQAEVMNENEDLKEIVRELESSVKAKEKELAEALLRFESLESEYMVLYHEKQSTREQPDV